MRWTTSGSIILSYRLIDSNHFEISVFDSGQYISEEECAKLNKAFARNHYYELEVLQSQLIPIGVLISNKMVCTLNNSKTGLYLASSKEEGNIFSFQIWDQKGTEFANLTESSYHSEISDLPYLECRLFYPTLNSNDKIPSYVASYSIVKGSTMKEKDSMPSLISCSGNASMTNNKHLKKSKSKVSQATTSKYKLMTEILAISEISYKTCFDADFSIDGEMEIIKIILRTRKCKCPISLIVDNNDFNSIALQAQLKKLDVSCQNSFNLEDTIIKLREMSQSNCCKYFKIVFINLELPFNQGFQIFDKIKTFYDDKEFIGNQVIVIGITSLSQNNQTYVEIRQKGFDELLNMPLSIESLIILFLKILQYGNFTF